MKTNVFKSFMYLLVSACFLIGGIFIMSTKKDTVTYADTSIVEDVENNVQDYVGIEVESGDAVSNTLINDDIFLYNGSNSLKIFLKTNGEEVNSGGGQIYDYVYYPDENNLSMFYFYRINGINLSINGVDQSLEGKSFSTSSNLSFQNLVDVMPESFEINFGNTADADDTFNILDDSGNLIEGLYTLQVEIDLWQALDGRTDQTEERFQNTTDETLTYSFFVLRQNSYIVNNRPVFTQNNFDSSTTISTTINPNYGNYLYSNYSYEGNRIASLTYDQTKYDVTILKELNSSYQTATLSYIAEDDNGETSGYTLTGDEIIRYQKNGEQTTIYFYDIGNYSVSFDAVATFSTSENMYNKYQLSALANLTKDVMVYVYGYQATHIDYDNNREFVEFKTYENEEGQFDGSYYHSADITANFLAYNSSFGQNTSSSDTTGSSTFVYTNILNYLNQTDENSNYIITPETTNQALVRFNLNATAILNGNVRSYVYSTTELPGYQPLDGANLHGQELYYTTYQGGSISDAGTYIFVLAYTFDQFYTTNAQRDANTIFYQVFFFEIDTTPPSVAINSESGKAIFSDTYTNESVLISNPNINNVHDKDVTVQVYAYDYVNDQYLSKYGGRYGIDMRALNNNSDTLELTENAHFTVRLYYTNEMNDTDIDVVNNRIIKQFYFTIDKIAIENVSARNVSLISGSSRYNILRSVEGISSNQNIIVSWSDKSSSAETFAYYRYFPLVTSNFYQEGLNTSNILQDFLLGTMGVSYIPINYSLDLTSEGRWTRYAGNTNGQTSTITSQYVLSESGMYVFDVYDEASNHSVEIFIIDNTAPLFVLETGSEFSLIPSYYYISEASTLYWGDYKTISIDDANGAINFRNISNIENATEANANYAIYKDYNGNTSLDIYRAFYNLLYRNNYIQYINCSSLTAPTTRAYLTFEIDDLIYETPIGSNNYQQATGKNSINLNDDREYTYRVLIRDESNTAYDYASSTTSLIQYTNYYSARQNVIISHDTSEFRLFYEETNNQGQEENVYLSSNLMVVSDDGDTLTTYLSPINVNELVYVSYIPTVADETTVQIDSVRVDYYAYVDKEIEVNGVTYYYRELSDERTSTTELYNYSEGQSTETNIDELFINNDGVTNEGMYVISREYNMDVTPTLNEQDYLTRRYVLYVDRNDVISSPVTKGEGSSSHSESLVGGEIFIGMYDSGDNTDLVITFPDSPDGNLNSTTLYDSNENSILSTNKLPLRIYVPTYKYTMYAQKTPLQVPAFDEFGNPIMVDGVQTTEESETDYYYEVVYNNENNQNAYNNLNAIASDLNTTDLITDEEGNVYIEEYLIFAEIYRNPTDGINTPIYRTTTTFSDPNPANAESENGFLTFYDSNGNPLTALTEEGTYRVVIYQGYRSDSSFRQLATFTFNIENTSPNFEARTTTRGRTLNSTTENGMTVYHTNQNNIQLIWSKPRDIYTAGIDTENFQVSVNGGMAVTMTMSDLFVNSGESQNSYYGNLNLSRIEVNGQRVTRHGDYVDITMQYENHNDAYYETITKRILLDREAPYTNIDGLVNSVIDNFYIDDFLTYEDFRVKENINGDIVTDNTETSYNTSTISGNFRYYSYAVESSFLNTLKNTSQDESFNIYYRVVQDKYNGNYSEITPETFLESNYSLISSLSAFASDTYYEIVESDLAGNLTIYTIYIVDYSTMKDNYALISYTQNETPYSFTKSDYVTAKQSTHNALLSIYAKPGLLLQDFNYFGNTWINFRVDKYLNEVLVTNYYLASPWLAEGKVYQIVGTANNTLSLQEVDIDELIDGSKDTRLKDSITVYDTTRGTTESFYFNTRNTALTSSLSNNSEREHITISQPSDSAIESTLTAQTYLTYIKIYTPAVTGVSTEEVYYEISNPLGYADGFTSNQNVTVTTTGTTITFELFVANLARDSRIIYEFTDNYGSTYSEIHLYQETTGYQEVDSNNILYSFYDRRDNNLTYITEDGFAYTYNERKYRIEIYEANNNELTGYTLLVESDLLNDTDTSIRLTRNISGSVIRNTYSIRDSSSKYNYKYRIDVYDAYATAVEGEELTPIKTVYFILNDQISTPNTDQTPTTEERQFYLTTNGSNVTQAVLGLSGATKVDFYSRVTLMYGETSENFLPIKYYISTDNVNFEEIASGTIISCPEEESSVTYYLKVWYDLDYIMEHDYYNQLSNSEYIFEIVPTNRVYSFTLSSTLQSAYYVELIDENGEAQVVSRSGSTYTSPDGTYQNPNHYIVNINYIDRNSRLRIVTNTEQYVVSVQENKPDLDGHYVDADNVRTYIYHISNLQYITGLNNIPRFDTYIAVTFIEPTDSIVEGFYSYNSSGNIDTNQNLITRSIFEYIVPDTSSLDQLKIEWSKYYAIRQNTIDIKISKNGIELTPTIYSERIGNNEYYYTYITRSGNYRINFVDKAGNSQTFSKGTTSQASEFTLVFLKDIPFTLSYINPETQEVVTTEPINEATYNGEVTLTIDSNLTNYYTEAGVSIEVTRNNNAYTGYTYNNRERSYTFSSTGYYTVRFSAISNSGSTQNQAIQSLTYSFTILNPNEYRYSYILNQYSNYYIEKIMKDGVDVTETFLNTLDLRTITINQKEYLAELALSYIDEKTGVGVYDITVNSNEKMYQSDNTQTSWTYRVIIEVGTDDLIFSNISPGATTKSTINLTFNTANVYNEFGNSFLQVVHYTDNGARVVDYSFEIDAESTGVQTYNITDANTYFVQLVSPSNILLYSYKVTKEDPFNAATIIAIVVSIVVVIGVAIIVILLRKRIKVK